MYNVTYDQKPKRPQTSISNIVGSLIIKTSYSYLTYKLLITFYMKTSVQ